MSYSQGIARFYDLFPRTDGDGDDVARFLQPVCAPGTSVLEIGAGVGNTTFALAARGVHTTALEPDAEMYAVLLSRLALRTELHRLVSPLPRPAGHPLRATFDCCACFAVVHLLQAEQRAALVAYAVRQLRPGGQLILEMPMASSARVSKSWSRIATLDLGSVSFEHHSAVEPVGDGWWFTHWMFRILEGGSVVEEVLQSFHWQALALAESEQLLAAHGLVVDEEFGGFDRSPFVPGQSRVRLVVAHAPDPPPPTAPPT